MEQARSIKIQPGYFLIIILLQVLTACTTDYEEPEVSLADYQMEEGFELSVVASEPFLEAPVAIDFDLQGRVWVAEMRGYMTNINGDGEDLPSGTISILEDRDGDGVADHSSIFLDGLVMPRALALVYGGLLYAEPPNLWFVEIEIDKPGKKILVDSLYADDGNVEHQPNGLLMNIDNWIYNAKSHFRYQRKNGKWLKEPTSYRGQWGISKDNVGRLYYNNNSVLIQGDAVLPNVLINNPYFQPVHAIGKSLTESQRVYPLHATSVNRGYEKGVLDEDSLLLNTTSACGPVIYRGGQFLEGYLEDAFVCAPEVNLVKRIELSFDGFKTSGAFQKDKEFLASTDEAFRPVNLFTGPDGALYVVDMHRGIIQHGAYMSPYLRKHLEAKGLDKVIGMGRILKVKSKDKPLLEIPDLENASIGALIKLLQHSNGWVRDKAQQLLVMKSTKEDVKELEKLAGTIEKPIAQLHALYVLAGMEELQFDLLYRLAKTSEPAVVAHSLLLMSTLESNPEINSLKTLTEHLIQKNDPTIDLYLIVALGKWLSFSDETFSPFLYKLLKRHSDPIVYEAVVSSLAGREEIVMRDSITPELNLLLSNVIENRKIDKKNWIFEKASVEEDDRSRGLRFYKTICAACHGSGGAGMEGLAPPLRGSEYVLGSEERLALIILHGLKGPVHVNGIRYEFNTEMPGIATNAEMSDQDITDLIMYLNNAFGTSKNSITVEQIQELRKMKPASGEAFTEEELNTLKQ